MCKNESDDGLLQKVIQFERGALSDKCIAPDFLVLVRQLAYFCSRTKPKIGKPRKLFLFCSLACSMANLLKFMLSPKPGRIAVAPASHRRPYGRQLVSKHADALKREAYVDRILEVGAINGWSNLLVARNISLAVRLLIRIVWLPKKHLNSLDNALLVDGLSSGIGLEFTCDDLSILRRNAIFFEKYKKIYRLLYSWRKPSQLVCVAYYADVEILAQISVCKELGVSVMDYQHGIQNDGHFMYVGWQHFPERPSCLPDLFYVWDEVAAARISNAFNGGADVRLVGNLWMRSVVNAEIKIQPASDYILVALQAWPDFFPQFLWSCIARNRNLKWVFREHPNFLLMDQQKREILYGNPNVSFESLDLPIEASLSGARLCVTGFSTVALDAKYLGRKSVFTHPKAKAHLDAYIDDRDIFYAGSVEELEEVLDRFIN